MSYRLIVVLVTASCWLLVADSTMAQGGLPPGTTPDDLTNDIINQVNNSGGAANTGTTTGTGTTNDFGSTTSGGESLDGTDLGPELSFDQTMIEVEADSRNQRGFVGASIASPDPILAEYRFVGPQSDSITSGTTTVTNPRGSVGGAGNNTENGFQVTRGVSPVRTRIVRSFRAPTISPNFVSSRINRRFASLPATRQFSNSMNVTMQGRTAIITGTARSQAQIDRIRRQLRLEPGVSRIDSKVQIANENVGSFR